ncbi:hypothetical protein CERZMDRAFT_84522 [Cercospora zeae-maydis SCOH1-5]|uniref:Uncharacterized protein n=1 Tax=Cercospora zeae-maydis SCOH1-5 TaxID=717836 RepID=A0A6A6FHR5_9PEZI|nr:hypothetical protein CERZMDRAFT_84522 [Cercospora zeae-maydis SCOH1-5]
MLRSDVACIIVAATLAHSTVTLINGVTVKRGKRQSLVNFKQWEKHLPNLTLHAAKLQACFTSTNGAHRTSFPKLSEETSRAISTATNTFRASSPSHHTMQPATWDLKTRLSALSVNPIDRTRLDALEPRKRKIAILNWARCLRADGKTLFAIVRVPFVEGSTGKERKKATVKEWVQQPEAVKDYFAANSARVVGGDLDALFEVLDLYGCADLGRHGKKEKLSVPGKVTGLHALSQPSPPQDEPPLVAAHWKMSLSDRLRYFGAEPLDAEKLRRLQPTQRDHYISTWCNFTSKFLAGLKYLPAYTSNPSEIMRSKTAYAWHERFWSTVSPSKREHFARAIAELDQGSKGVSVRFVRMITSELGAYAAITAFYAGLAFPPPKLRHPKYKLLDLEGIFGDPRVDKLEAVNNYFDGEDQDLFYFHLFPMICEGVDGVATDPAVHGLVDSLWQGLQWEEKATWKEGAWWLKTQLKRKDLVSLVKLLPCNPLDGSTDYHSMAEDLLLRWAQGKTRMGEQLPKESQQPSFLIGPQDSSALLVSFSGTSEPAESTTDEIINEMGTISVLE